LTEPEAAGKKSEFLRVGEIIKPHGIDGELVVQPSTDFPEERFHPNVNLSVFRGNEWLKELIVKDYRWHQGRILLDVEGVDDRDTAETFRDCWFGIPVDDVADEVDGYFEHQLVGLDVYSSGGDRRGVIAEVHPDSMNPLITIELDDETFEFPLSPGLIESVDEDENRIVLLFPDGWKKLLDET